jgi:hypothetical protein
MTFDELVDKIVRAGGLMTFDELGFVTINIDRDKLIGAFDGNA